MKALALTTALLSVCAAIAYFSPWYAADARKALNWYIPAFLWLLIAWVFVPVNVVLAVKAKKSQDTRWHIHAWSACVTTASYVVVVGGAAKGYMVSV